MDAPSAAMTMAFVVIALGAVFGGLSSVVIRSAAHRAAHQALAVLSIPTIAMILATELPVCSAHSRPPLTGEQWLDASASP